MNAIRIVSMIDDRKKISLIKLICRINGDSLKESQKKVNMLLFDNEPIILNINDGEDLYELKKELYDYNAVFDEDILT